MRVRCYETIYLVKKVESNDAEIILYTFSGETLVLDIPK